MLSQNSQQRHAVEYRSATTGDLDLLAVWNKQLIEDSGHDNPMSVAELRERMAGWLAGEYRGILFIIAGAPVAYAVYKERDDHLYLRQFFVDRAQRRKGIGTEAMALLGKAIFPSGKRVQIEVMAWNKPGSAFWKSAGFHPRYLGMELAT
jgi:GNAT superfamily N-acetyltransferase